MGWKPCKGGRPTKPQDPVVPDRVPTDEEYRRLAAFRSALREFLRFSEDRARDVHLTPQQHQLLLAVRGYPGRPWATISELAERLKLRSHSVVGLVDRLARGGYVERTPNPEDGRSHRIALTARGEEALRFITVANLGALRGVQRTLEALLSPGSAISHAPHPPSPASRIPADPGGNGPAPNRRSDRTPSGRSGPAASNPSDRPAKKGRT